MKPVTFSPRAFKEYNEWASTDKKAFRKIFSLIKEVSRTPFRGEGKPEALKHDLKGFWSRSISHEHRLVYKVGNDGVIYIASCKGHYS